MTNSEKVVLTTEENHQVAGIAYDTKDQPYRGFHVRASYLQAPKEHDALIEVFRDGQLWRSFKYPAYRIYNIAAHYSESIDEALEEEVRAEEEPPEPDGECYRGGEAASALAEEQGRVMRELKR